MSRDKLTAMVPRLTTEAHSRAFVESLCDALAAKWCRESDRFAFAAFAAAAELPPSPPDSSEILARIETHLAALVRGQQIPAKDLAIDKIRRLESDVAGLRAEVNQLTLILQNLMEKLCNGQ